MSDVILFCGPTLAGLDVPAAVLRLPPAGLGDMLAAAPKSPSTLILIDGLFGRQRSPWHKEILTVMAAGHRVIGAASMGALRACELHHYGMIGIGVVFRAYRRGLLFDDGDVAVTHAPPELGWRPVSVALVDVLVALGRARRAGAIDREMASVVDNKARAMSFKDRSWNKILDGLPIAHEVGRMLSQSQSTQWPPQPAFPPQTGWQRFLP
jgi:hypothetical protein